MRKETLVFLTSLAIIFIIGYVNMTMTPENVFNEEDYAQFEEEVQSDLLNDELAQIIDNTDVIGGAELVEVIEHTDKTDLAVNAPVAEEPGKGSDIAEVTDEATEEVAEVAQNEVAVTDVTEVAEDELDYVILGDITNILEENSVVASSNGLLDMLNANFASFKLNKEKGNMDVVDHLEESLSNQAISVETKNQFEALLLNKNEYISTEKNIELMLQTKGYKETVVIVDNNMVKVVTNDKIEQADATKILDVIVSETNYEPAQIKIVKFDNIDL